MGTWAWVGIWAGIVLLTLIGYAILLLDLASKAERVARQLGRLQNAIEQVQSNVGRLPKLESEPPAIEQDLQDVLAKRDALVRNKAKQQEARARRLIKALDAIEVDETRFPNG